MSTCWTLYFFRLFAQKVAASQGLEANDWSEIRTPTPKPDTDTDQESVQLVDPGK